MTQDNVSDIIKKIRERHKSMCKIRHRRHQKDLSILIHFMYYCHLKCVDALKITPDDIVNWTGYFYSEKNKSRMKVAFPLEVRIEIDEACYKSKKSNNGNKPLITTKKRALQFAFRQIVDEISDEIGIEKCRLTDVYYAGWRDNPQYPGPQKVDEE